MAAGKENGECCRRRGRPRMHQGPNGPLRGPLRGRCYAPQCNIDEQKEVIYLFPEEIAALDLIDIQQLGQEEASILLGVSRKTVWRDIHEARRKVADGILNGKVIIMKECATRMNGACPKQDETLFPKTNGGSCPRDSATSGNTVDK